MIYLYLILISIIVILVALTLTLKEKFVYISPYIDSATHEEVTEMVKNLIKTLNFKFNKRLIVRKIDKIEKTTLSDGINYRIHIFIYNPDKYTTRKVLFNIDFKNGRLYLNDMKSSYSRPLLKEERDPVTARGTRLLKPKVNIDTLEGVVNDNVKHSKRYQESSDGLSDFNVDRNAWILSKEASYFEGVPQFPNKKVDHRWDTFGISQLNKNLDSDTDGINTSSHVFKKIPNFIISNFYKSKDLDWLFDLSQDSASRPIGITGAKGG